MPTRFVWMINALVVLMGGTVSLFIAFLMAYGFADDVSTVHHFVFLCLVAGSIGVWGLVLGAIDTPMLAVPFSRGFTIGLSVAISLHLAAVAIGTLISLANEEHNSVTADQPTAPFIALVIVASALATVAARAATRLMRARPTLTS